MKIMKFSDFLFGIAEFSVTDGFFDEFISACCSKRVVIYDLKADSDKITGRVHFSDIRCVSEAAAKSGMNFTVTHRAGLPHIFYRYRHRFGIPIGLLVFTVISAILHSVIWSIDISPVEFTEEQNILNVLHSEGIFVGAFSDPVICKEAEYLLYKEFEDISWVNVRVVGTRLFVDISEVRGTQQLKTEKYTNIVASKDGEIVTAEIIKGEGELFSGAAVVKGDLLISGIINHRDGSVKFVDAEGKIYARTKNFIASTIPDVINVNIIKSCKDIYLPVFFGLSADGIINVKSGYFTDSRYFTDGKDVIFPLGLIRRHIISFEEAMLTLAEGQSVLLCFRDFAKRCLKLRENTEIIGGNIRLSLSCGAEFSADFLCLEDIALKKEFTVEDN